jgi:REP element-mobilizing transposase RayT
LFRRHDGGADDDAGGKTSTRDQWSRLYNLGMVSTIGYHVVKTGYGLWLPGDDRGSWSEAWDDDVGFIEPHMLHEGDPVRLRMAEERMKTPPVRFTGNMIDAIVDAIAECVAQSNGGLPIAAMTIEPTHMHLLIAYSGRDIDVTMKWIADQTTKVVHRMTSHRGPVWSKGKWRSFIFDVSYWANTGAYIRRHNERQGLAADPYGFITPRDL